jgi:hypothetical protein
MEIVSTILALALLLASHFTAMMTGSFLAKGEKQPSKVGLVVTILLWGLSEFIRLGGL